MTAAPDPRTPDEGRAEDVRSPEEQLLWDIFGKQPSQPDAPTREGVLSEEEAQLLREEVYRWAEHGTPFEVGIGPAVERIVTAHEAVALREAAKAWPFEMNAETLRRESETLSLRDAVETYTPADWLRDRADRIEGAR